VTARIALLCATRRGLRVLERLIQLAPDSELLVVSFPEEPGEPPFLKDIQSLALARGAAFVETRRVGNAEHQNVWDRTLDLLLAVSWRYMVPADVYRRARLGAFVLHDSLLPKYRGFAPTVWAIVNGEDHTGATLFEMGTDVDAGPIVDQRTIPIGDDDKIKDVVDRVTDAYLSLLDANLSLLLDGTAPRHPQNHREATYTCKRVESDGRIDWSTNARSIHNLVRAHTSPYWGAFTTLAGEKMRIWETRLLPDFPTYVGRVPGRVVEIRPGIGTVVLTGDGTLLLTRVQWKGETLGAAEVLKSPTQTLGH
jgi:methionyl-tRNA formyltransferase